MRRRIIICLGLLLALCLLGNAIAMFCLDRSIDQVTSLAESHRIQSMRVELMSSGVRIESDLLSYLVGDPVDEPQRQRSLERFERTAQSCAQCHHEPDVRADLDAVRATFAEYKAKSRVLFSRADRAFPSDRQVSRTVHDQLEHDVQAVAATLVRQTSDLSDQAAGHLSLRGSDVSASVRQAWLVLSITLVVVLIVGGVIAFHLKRRLTKPIAALLAGIERASEGAPKPLFVIDGDEEFKTLGRAFDEAYRNLEAAQAGILQAEKMAAVGRLAAGLAHEVRNPLASISCVAQVMKQQPDRDGQAERLELIIEEVNRINRIVQEMLTFSRPSPIDHTACVDIASLLEHAIKLLRYDGRAEQVKMTCDVANLPDTQGHSDHLLLVFTNIMINALDALSGKNGQERTLQVTARHEKDFVVIRFADNGQGMTEEQLAKAFEPFYTSKDPDMGTGLGLWVCYQVVHRHKGTIDLESRPGEGTVATVRLPCHGSSGDRPHVPPPVGIRPGAPAESTQL